MYPPIQIANELIARYGSSGQIEPLKLQKLLYFANGWYLALTGRPLVNEKPQVWRYGPVFRSVYRAFNHYGSRPIIHPAPSTPFGGDAERVEATPELENYLNWVWNEYGQKSGPRLSDETHKPGTPWRNIAEKNGFVVPQNTEIPPEDDWRYFGDLARERGWRTEPLAQA
ncbi:Panacea domain-containing protein [Mesorhizobium sp. 10J20-29]